MGSNNLNYLLSYTELTRYSENLMIQNNLWGARSTRQQKIPWQSEIASNKVDGGVLFHLWTLSFVFMEKNDYFSSWWFSISRRSKRIESNQCNFIDFLAWKRSWLDRMSTTDEVLETVYSLRNHKMGWH